MQNFDRIFDVRNMRERKCVWIQLRHVLKVNKISRYLLQLEHPVVVTAPARIVRMFKLLQ